MRGVGEKIAVFLNPEVCVSSGEYRVHTDMMEEWKRGWSWNRRKTCQESLMCNLFCLSPIIYFILSLLSCLVLLNSICCYFCTFLCSGTFLVSPLFSLSLSVSLSFSGCQVFGVVRTNQAQPWCNYCQSDWGGGDRRKECGKLSALQP